jgi:hypothetical protein
MNSNGNGALQKRSGAPLSLMHPSRQSGQAPNWAEILKVMAVDLRHELLAPVLCYWQEKLKPFADEDISKALIAGRWKFFPSVDDVIESIETHKEQERSRVQEKQTAEYLRELRKLPDPQEQAEIKAMVAELSERLQIVAVFPDPKGRRAVNPEKAQVVIKESSPQLMTDAQLRDRREILRQQMESLKLRLARVKKMTKKERAELATKASKAAAEARKKKAALQPE